MKQRILIAIGLVILVLIAGGGWYVKAVNQSHPAPWPMMQGDALGRFATKATFPDEPALLWSYPLDGRGVAFPVIGADGTLYVHTDTSVLAIDPDGNRRWSWRSNHGPGWLALSRQGEVYALGERRLVALDGEGRTKWRYDLQGEASAPPLVGQGGVIYVKTDRQLEAISSDGAVKWVFTYDHQPTIWPVETRDGMVILATMDRLYALKPDGSEAWNLKLGTPGGPVPLSVGEDGMIYYRTAKELHVIDKEGRVQLGFMTSQQMGWNLAVSSGVIQSGRFRWSTAGEETWAMQWIGDAGFTYLDAKGQALFWSQVNPGGRIAISLWAADGSKRWQLDQVEVYGPAAIGKDGQICFVGVWKESGSRQELICVGEATP